MKFPMTLILAGGLMLLVGCSAPTHRAGQGQAELKDTQGKTVGSARFAETEGGVIVRVEVSGLSPGLHAVHVHAVGKCDAPSFTSAAGHFNPAQKKHGFKTSDGPHAGDMPNMYVGKDGAGRFEVMTDQFTLRAGERSVFDADGSALVIHAGVDDYTTDPAGNAGDRVACGVIMAGANS